MIALLQPHAEMLAAKTGADFGPNGKGDYMLFKAHPQGHSDEQSWGEIMDWMNESVALYRDALKAALEASPQ